MNRDNWKELGNGIWPHSRDGVDDGWDVVALMMDNDIREDVHNRLAPCSKHEFLAEYLRLDPEFGTCTAW